MTESGCSAAFVRYLFARKTLACARHRAAVARRLGLNETQMRAVVCIAYDGELSAGRLRSRLGLTSAGVAGVLAALAQSGFVERRPDPRDKRRTMVRLTPEGRELAERGFARLAGGMDEVFAELPDDESRRIVAWYLERVVEVSDAAAVAAASDEQLAPPPATVPA